MTPGSEATGHNKKEKKINSNGSGKIDMVSIEGGLGNNKKTKIFFADVWFRVRLHRSKLQCLIICLIRQQRKIFFENLLCCIPCFLEYVLYLMIEERMEKMPFVVDTQKSRKKKNKISKKIDKYIHVYPAD